VSRLTKYQSSGCIISQPRAFARILDPKSIFIIKPPIAVEYTAYAVNYTALSVEVKGNPKRFWRRGEKTDGVRVSGTDKDFTTENTEIKQTGSGPFGGAQGKPFDRPFVRPRLKAGSGQAQGDSARGGIRFGGWRCVKRLFCLQTDFILPKM